MSADQKQSSITLWHRLAAAGGASLVSAVIVNPLDVVKTRIQAQAAQPFSNAAAASQTLLEKWSFAGCSPTCIRNSHPTVPTTECGPACAPYTGTIDALRKIARREGMRSLWRGTDVSLMMSIPMVGIYLPLYDYLLADMQQQQAGPLAPLMAGTVARTVAVYCTAPFELIRTRMQAAGIPLGAFSTSQTTTSAAAAVSPRLILTGLPGSSSSSSSSMHSQVRRIGKLWTGVGATLARDVPFSGLYWMMVEPIRDFMLPQAADSKFEVAQANIIAGGTAGGLAGAFTTPLDVVKTRTQLAATEKAHPLLSTLRNIAQNEGVRGLYVGWGPRAAKAAPACALVLSAYEMLKFAYVEK